MKIKKDAVIFLSAMFLAAVFLMAFFLNKYVGNSLLKESDDRAKAALQTAMHEASSMDAVRESIESTFDSEMLSRAETASYLLRKIEREDTLQQTLNNYMTLLCVDNIVVISSEGDVEGFGVATRTDFRDEAFSPITGLSEASSDRPVVEALSGDAVYRYYGSAIDSGHIAVVVMNRRDLDSLVSGYSGWKSKLQDIVPEGSGYIMAVSGNDGSILYHPEKEYTGKEFSVINSGNMELSDETTVTSAIDGIKSRITVRKMNGDYLLAVIPYSDIFGSFAFLEGLVVFVFASFLIVMAIYALSIHESEIEEELLSESGKRQQRKFSRRVFSGILLYLILGITATGIVFYYVNTIGLLGTQSMMNLKELKRAENAIAKNSEERALFETDAERIVKVKADVTAFILDHIPEASDTSGLQEAAHILGLNEITVFNSKGTQTASSSGTPLTYYAADNKGAAAEFKSLLKGGGRFMSVPEYDENSKKVVYHAASVLIGEDNTINGYAAVAYEPFQLNKIISSGEISSLLNEIGKTSKGSFLAVSGETGKIVYSTSRKTIGLSLDSVVYYNGFSGFLTLNGTEYFADCIMIDNYYLINGLSSDKILKKIDSFTFAVSAAAAVLLFLFSIVLSLKITGGIKADAGQILEFILPDGSIKRRFANEGKIRRWNEKSPSQKASSAVKAMILLLCTIITVMYLFPEKLIRSNSILNYIFAGNWEKGFNIFAVTGALVSLSVIVVIRQVIDFLLRLLASNSDARTETICRLMMSFLKYITALLCIYYCLAKLGVDTDTLLASAGLLSLIIGLGAQDLIKDILAGLFIIFEEEFKVGDIVTVDDFTGTVREIGIRATKIEDIGQNIKVINNNQISGVLNKTQKYSYAIVDVGIEYSESVERVEAVLKEELPEIKKKYPEIISGPSYKGVVEMSDSAVIIRIAATCTEGKRIPLTFALNREVKLIFDRNNINIPFNQIVVHKED